MKISLSWCSPRLRALVCFASAVLGVGAASVSYGATESVPIIELRCKIVSSTVGAPLSAWAFQLRKSTGELVHVQVVLNGQTVKVKNLSPAIYIACLAGAAGRESCESMDLNPPKHKSARIVKELSTPTASAMAEDQHVVSTARLAVPAEASAEMQSAQDAQMQGDDEQARAHWERALEIYPEYPQALNNLGTYYYRLGRYTDSIDLLTKATRLDPDLYAAWVNLSGSLMAVARFDDALSTVQRALELRPNDALANSRAGMAYYYKRDYVEASKYFRKSRNLDPAAASSPQLFLVHIALGQGHPEEAEKYLREYLEVHPNAPNAAQMRLTLKRLEAGDFGPARAGVIPPR